MNITRALFIFIVIGLVLVAGYFYRHDHVVHNVVPVSTKTASSTHTKLTSVMYACNHNKTITATYYQGPVAPPSAPGEPPTPTGSVDLVLSDGRTLTLKQTLSADGARYSDGDQTQQGSESFVFWSKGEGALVLEHGQQQSYTGCVAVAPATAQLPNYYHDGTTGFTIRYPQGWTPDPAYKNTLRGPAQAAIPGVLFHIPTAMATGTNLSAFDTGLSVETLASTSHCTASAFLATPATNVTTTIHGTVYSVASSSDAAVGNRYETVVYALPHSNPCLAVRSFIHYGDIHNYPAGAVQPFDRVTLRKDFDAMRDSLIHVQ